MLENVLEGSLGVCAGESWAVSLTGNEGAGRGWMKDAMVGRGAVWSDTDGRAGESLKWSIAVS